MSIGNCGHEVKDSAPFIRIGGSDCDAATGFYPTVAFIIYCAPCRKRARRWPEFIRTDEEEGLWLSEKHPVQIKRAARR